LRLAEEIPQPLLLLWSVSPPRYLDLNLSSKNYSVDQLLLIVILNVQPER
jgi:hypothetical protein